MVNRGSRRNIDSELRVLIVVRSRSTVEKGKEIPLQQVKKVQRFNMLFLLSKFYMEYFHYSWTMCSRKRLVRVAVKIERNWSVRVAPTWPWPRTANLTGSWPPTRVSSTSATIEMATPIRISVAIARTVRVCDGCRFHAGLKLDALVGRGLIRDPRLPVLIIGVAVRHPIAGNVVGRYHHPDLILLADHLGRCDGHG